MRQTILTRRDEAGVGSYDSIAWAYEVHVGLPDPGTYHFAILHGNEDAPDSIEFYEQAEPLVTDRVAFVWSPAA